MKAVHMIAWILLIVGGLNWLLTGVIKTWDLASYIGGTVAMIVYILVGLAALLELFTHKNMCKNCGSGSKPPMGGGATGMTQ